MPNDIRTSTLWVKGINTDTEVIAVIQRMQKLIMDRQQSSWSSEGDSGTLEYGLEPDVVIGLAIQWLKKNYPCGEWGAYTTSCRQFRN